MSQKGFYFDMTSCTGCKCCQVACKDVNDLPVGRFFRRARDFEGGSISPYVGGNAFHGLQSLRRRSLRSKLPDEGSEQRSGNRACHSGSRSVHWLPNVRVVVSVRRSLL